MLPNKVLLFIAGILVLYVESIIPVMSEVPIIDLSCEDEAAIVAQVRDVCSTLGFFQIIRHGVDERLIEAFRQASVTYFALDLDKKTAYRRDASNARGFFDDELTKQKRDWKQALDVGVPGSRDWIIPDDDPRNTCLDGFNRFPTEEEVPGFRDCVREYFEACQELSARLARLMALGLQLDYKNDSLLQSLEKNESSYLRMNYYPPCPLASPGAEHPLGISPHKDAGFLTILLQDDDTHSLQVASYTNDKSDFDDLEWVTVYPEPGALTVNTGDMCQIWSNGRYKANLHRVLTDPESERYSAPFFYNPGYDAWVKPQRSNSPLRYRPCLWGYFRAMRFAGDLTDLGTEIQVSDYEVRQDGDDSPHMVKQKRVADVISFDEAFSVDRYRPLLTDDVTY